MRTYGFQETLYDHQIVQNSCWSHNNFYWFNSNYTIYTEMKFYSNLDSIDTGFLYFVSIYFILLKAPVAEVIEIHKWR